MKYIPEYYADNDIKCILCNEKIKYDNTHQCNVRKNADINVLSTVVKIKSKNDDPIR